MYANVFGKCSWQIYLPQEVEIVRNRQILAAKKFADCKVFTNIL
jgi:hypothetical protein